LPDTGDYRRYDADAFEWENAADFRPDVPLMVISGGIPSENKKKEKLR
jgi:hypothetical protein